MSAASPSVEQDGVGVPVGDLRHVFQNVLFGDDAQQSPADKRKVKQSSGVKVQKCHMRSGGAGGARSLEFWLR